MTPAAIIRQSAADGVALVLLPTGTIKARGDQEAVSRWVPLLREHKSGIVAILEEATRESFDFNPPSNPANDDEALLELFHERSPFVNAGTKGASVAE